MRVKFLDHGTDSGRGAARYLLQADDSAGQRRAAVEVLRGNPELVGTVNDIGESSRVDRSARSFQPKGVQRSPLRGVRLPMRDAEAKALGAIEPADMQQATAFGSATRLQFGVQGKTPEDPTSIMNSGRNSAAFRIELERLQGEALPLPESSVPSRSCISPAKRPPRAHGRNGDAMPG